MIPATVKAIGKKAFAYCSNLKEIRILGTNITKVWSGAFKKIAPDAVIVIVTDDEKAFNKLAKIIKKSGIGKGVSIVREGTDAQKS